MRYICLVHVDGELAGAATKERFEVIDRDSRAHDEDLDRRGKLVLASPLAPPESATIVKRRDGNVSMLNGPYSETKEHLGGVLIIEARDLNEAVDIASKVPMAEMGSIEVRAMIPIPAAD
jgi:hypothetical protein